MTDDDTIATDRVQINLERLERRKLQAEDSAAAMKEYIADERHRRMNTEKLRAERLAREAALLAPVAPIVEAPLKVKAKRKSRKLSS